MDPMFLTGCACEGGGLRSRWSRSAEKVCEPSCSAEKACEPSGKAEKVETSESTCDGFGLGLWLGSRLG